MILQRQVLMCKHDRLNIIIAAWRAETEQDIDRELIDIDTALAQIRESQERPRVSVRLYVFVLITFIITIITLFIIL